MAIKPTKPTTPPKALRSEPATFPARAEGTVDFLFGDNLDYVDDSNTFVDDRADQALASAVAAAAGNLDAAQRETFAGYLVGVSEDAGNPLEAVEIVEKPDLTQAQVEDDTSTVMGAVSGQRLAQAFDAREQQIGVGQTWQDVLASRTAGTTYQNTTGRPIMVAISAQVSSAGRRIEVSSDGVTWVEIHLYASTSVNTLSSFIVPDTWRYRTTGGALNISQWAELR